MPLKVVLLPVFALVALTLALLVALLWSRFRALRRRDVRMKDVALGQQNWPERIAQLGNAYRSQFELPLLFYALVAFEALAGAADMAVVGLEWAFVLSRFAHAYIHVTSNHVPSRFLAFAVGFVLLVIMWAVFAARIVLS